MYAVIASGISRVVKTQHELDAILAIYPYPKFKKVRTELEGFVWLRSHERSYHERKYNNYGDTVNTGYAEITYWIYDNKVYYNISTAKVGTMRLFVTDDNIKVDSRATFNKVIIENVVLDNNIIYHHLIAIRRILNIIGEYVDVNIVVPDISIYLACVSYTGMDTRIRDVQRQLNGRLGGVAFTVRECFE